MIPIDPSSFALLAPCLICALGMACIALVYGERG